MNSRIFPVNPSRGLLEESCVRWIVQTLLVALTFGMMLELGPFNGLHWMMSSSSEEQMSFMIGNGIKKISNDTFEVVNQNDANITVKGINKTVKTLYLPIASETPMINLSISASDGANELGANLSDTSLQISPLYSPSQYFATHFRNKVRDISIDFSRNGVGTLLKMDKVGINVQPPLALSKSRALVVTLIAFLILSLVPSSGLWKTPLFQRDSQGSTSFSITKIVVIGYAIIGVCVFLLVVYLHSAYNSIFNSSFYESKSGTVFFHTQFACLAKSLLKGRVDLDIPVASYLKDMSNPYDPGARIANATRTGEPFYLDAAYRNGKYYCYFGVLPILLTYLPYLALLGKDMPNIYAIIIFGLAAIASLNYLSYQLVRRFAPDAPVGAFVAVSAILICSSGFAFWATTLSFYTIPLVSALAFGGLGLAFLLKASIHSGERIPRLQVGLGAFFIAITLGCRPQFVLVGLLAIPIFWNEIVYSRLFFSKKGIWNTIIFFLPFVFVAILQFAYNYSRFGSLLDFGASYNLTGNDMTSRGFVFSRIPLGLFSYVFQPFTVGPAFPFFSTASMTNNYVGLTSHEDIYAGLLFTSPVTLLSIYLCKMHGYRIQTRSSWRFFVWTAVLTFLILVIDIEASGIVERYKSDFGWIISMGSISIIIDSIKVNPHQSVDNNRAFANVGHESRAQLLSIAAIATVFATVACIFMSGKAVSLESVNPKFYSEFMTAVRYALG